MSIEKKYCPVCGSIVQKQDNNCDNCGENLFASESHSEESIIEVVDEASSFTRSIKEESKPASTTKFCPDCGSQITTDNNFCPQCGFNLRATKLNQTKTDSSVKLNQTKTASSVKSKQKTKTPQQKKHSLKKQYKIEAWQLIVSIIVVAIIVIAVIMSSNSSSNRSAKDSSTVNLQALDKARAYVEANPNDAQGVLRYANILHDSKMLDQAIVYYKKYLDLVPDNPDARIDLGACYFELKQFPEAIRQMEIAVKKHPDHQLGNFNLGIVNLNSGNVDKGIEWLKKTIAINPDNEVGKKAKKFIQQAQSAGGMK